MFTYLRQGENKRACVRSYIELKTHRTLDDERAFTSFKKYGLSSVPSLLTDYFRFKLLKVWIQSFLVDTPRIVFGHRDQQGSVVKIASIQTKEIPGLGKDFWVRLL